MELIDLSKEMENAGYVVKIVPYGIYGSPEFKVILFEKFISVDRVRMSLLKTWKEIRSIVDGPDQNNLTKWFCFERNKVQIELQDQLMGKKNNTNLFMSADKPF